MEYRYEDLIDNFEATTAKVVNFLGLEQREDINYRDFHLSNKSSEISTPSYEAVTQPLNRNAIQRWRNYPHAMDEYSDRLKPALKYYQYE